MQRGETDSDESEFVRKRPAPKNLKKPTGTRGRPARPKRKRAPNTSAAEKLIEGARPIDRLPGHRSIHASVGFETVGWWKALRAWIEKQLNPFPLRSSLLIQIEPGYHADDEDTH